MLSNNPIEIDGKTFDRLNFSLAITTRMEGGRYTAGAALTFFPARITNDMSEEIFSEGAISVSTGDTVELMQRDRDAAELIGTISAAMESYAKAKNY